MDTVHSRRWPQCATSTLSPDWCTIRPLAILQPTVAPWPLAILQPTVAPWPLAIVQPPVAPCVHHTEVHKVDDRKVCGHPHEAYQVKSYDMRPAFYPREKHI